jgi:hypothetical protein
MAFPSDDFILTRAEYLREVADSLIEGGIISDKEILFRTNRIKLLTEAYFVLNEAYKKWRISDGHHTQPPKIAALTCIVIQELQPFLPKHPDDAKTFQQARCNEIFALACASAIMGVPIHKKKMDIYLRLLDVLAKCSCETIQPYIVDRSAQNQKALSTYNFDIIEKDKFAMDSLITIFEILWLSKGSKIKKSVTKKK